MITSTPSVSAGSFLPVDDANSTCVSEGDEEIMSGSAIPASALMESPYTQNALSASMASHNLYSSSRLSDSTMPIPASSDDEPTQQSTRRQGK